MQLLTRRAARPVLNGGQWADEASCLGKRATRWGCVWDGEGSLSPRRVWAVMPSHQGRYTHTSSSRFQSHRITSRSRCSLLVSRFRAFQVHRGRGRAHVDRCLTASVIFSKQLGAQAQRRLSATFGGESSSTTDEYERGSSKKDIKSIILNTEFLHFSGFVATVVQG